MGFWFLFLKRIFSNFHYILDGKKANLRAAGKPQPRKTERLRLHPLLPFSQHEGAIPDTISDDEVFSLCCYSSWV